MIIWLNGALRDESAAISPLDHGLTTGDGVFETLKIVDGQPFAVSKHLDRLVVSATGLGLPAPDLAQVRDAIATVVKADPDIAFGLCDLGMQCPELGSVSLSEIASVRGPGGLTIERDRHFTANKTLSEYATEARNAGRIKA